MATKNLAKNQLEEEIEKISKKVWLIFTLVLIIQ